MCSFCFNIICFLLLYVYVYNVFSRYVQNEISLQNVSQYRMCSLYRKGFLYIEYVLSIYRKSSLVPKSLTI
jgi:hypothetical protein